MTAVGVVVASLLVLSHVLGMRNISDELKKIRKILEKKGWLQLVK